MKGNWWIWVLSFLVPALVALLYFMPKIEAGVDLRILPSIYSSLNFITAVILIFALVAIKQKKQDLHKRLVLTALSMSALFLILYVIYHSTSESVKFGGEGVIRYVYFILLISHILLSAIIIPLVLITLRRAWLGQYEKHRKLAKWTWPLWFYVAVSGVLVYVMISPYY